MTSVFALTPDETFTFYINRSRKCLDSNGKVTIFAVKKGSDQSFLWKATVRIACVKCDPESNRIESYKLINLREFLKVVNTFQQHLEAMSSCEEQNDRVGSLISVVCKVQLSGELTFSRISGSFSISNNCFFHFTGTSASKSFNECG